jgi:hypothetical protein
MTAYKLVTVDVPYWGFGYRLEQGILGVCLSFSMLTLFLVQGNCTK